MNTVNDILNPSIFAKVGKVQTLLRLNREKQLRSDEREHFDAYIPVRLEDIFEMAFQEGKPVPEPVIRAYIEVIVEQAFADEKDVDSDLLETLEMWKVVAMAVAREYLVPTGMETNGRQICTWAKKVAEAIAGGNLVWTKRGASNGDD